MKISYMRVSWMDGIPYLEFGEHVGVSKGGKRIYIQWARGERQTVYAEGADNYRCLKKAIAHELLCLAHQAGGNIFVSESDRIGPFSMAKCVARVMRLYRHAQRARRSPG